MVIGNGMMAKQFAKYQNNSNVIIFASGVSNSKETKLIEFEREFNLLQKTVSDNSEKYFVYFGTISMYDPMAKESPYVLHKLALEKYITENCKLYNIFRVSQVIGRANNATLVNFIVNNIINDKEFDVWEHTTRNLIALNDVYKIIDYMLMNNINCNQIINVANSHNISVVDFIHIVENVIGKKSKMRIVSKGVPFDTIDINLIKPYLSELGICFDNYYYQQSLINMLN